MMVETLAWCNKKRRDNKEMERMAPAVQTVMSARGGGAESSPSAAGSRGGTPPSCEKGRGNAVAAPASGGPSASSGDGILALYGVRSPPPKRKDEDGVQIILSQETVGSSPGSTRKAGAVLEFRFLATNTHKHTHT